MITASLLALTVGLAAGALVNYLADVLPFTRRFSRPDCRNCHQRYHLQEYLLLKPCSHCGRGRPLRAWLILAGYSISSVLLWHFPPLRLGYWSSIGTLAYLGLVAIIDLEHRIVMHPLSLLGGLIGLAIGWQLHGINATLGGAGAGFGLMLALYYLGGVFTRFISRLRGTVVDEVALGYGDVILSGVLGLFLGWPGILLGLLFAILFGGLVSGFIILVQIARRRYQPFTAIPYAPFLILATLVLLFRPV